MQLEIQKNQELKNLTGWKTGGAAEFFCRPQNLQHLKEAFKWAKEKNQPITLLGGGTNVLISDQGVRGLVISLTALTAFEVKEDKNQLFISALCGLPKFKLMRIFAKYKLAPALFLSGLPGDVGGGVVMNAGVGHDVSPKEFQSIVEWVKVLSFDGNLKLFKKEDLKWQYRSCLGLGEGAVYEAGFSWPNEPLKDFHLKLKEMNQRRTSTQPLSESSCGSVFKNPPNEKAGRLIEKSGLKGHRIGGAEVSTRHANFIVNKGGALSSDIDRLICHVRETVKKDSNIMLEMEIRCLGEWKS